MNVTAIFCTADGCGACNAIKAKSNTKALSILETIIAAYKRQGIACLEYTATSPKLGFAETDVPYPILTKVNYFPCLVLVPTDLLIKIGSTITKELLDKTSIFSGIVNSSNLQSPFNLDQMSSYRINNPIDYDNFLSMYIRSGKSIMEKPIRLVTSHRK